VLAGAELRNAVRARCLEEFEERFGKPWEPRWVMPLTCGWHPPLSPNAPPDVAFAEEEARRVYESLRSAMREAQRFSGLPIEGGGRVAGFLRWWVPEFITPLLGHASMNAAPADWGPNLAEPRALLSKSLEDYDLFGVAPALGGGSSFLDAREQAIVSLLVGNWPAKQRGTVAEVIEAEAASMRHHIQERGTKPILQPDPEDPEPLAAKVRWVESAPVARGPKYRAKPKPKK